MMLAASIEPSALPAPSTVWISSMNRMMPPSAFLTPSSTCAANLSESTTYKLRFSNKYFCFHTNNAVSQHYQLLTMSKNDIPL